MANNPDWRWHASSQRSYGKETGDFERFGNLLAQNQTRAAERMTARPERGSGERNVLALVLLVLLLIFSGVTVIALVHALHVPVVNRDATGKQWREAYGGDYFNYSPPRREANPMYWEDLDARIAGLHGKAEENAMSDFLHHLDVYDENETRMDGFMVFVSLAAGLPLWAADFCILLWFLRRVSTPSPHGVL